MEKPEQIGIEDLIMYLNKWIPKEIGRRKKMQQIKAEAASISLQSEKFKIPFKYMNQILQITSMYIYFPMNFSPMKTMTLHHFNHLIPSQWPPLDS